MSTANGEGGNALAVRDLSKSFTGTRALHNVDFEMDYGEVRALVGGNGSGKSTLIKVLAGIEQPDSGATIVIGGDEVDATSLNPLDSFARGLRFVHQDPCIFDDLTVGENLALGARYATSQGGRISRRRLREWAARLLEQFAINVSPTTLMSELNPATKTMVAIARALGDGFEGGRHVLILDEVTAALPATECEAVFDLVQRVAARGHAVLFVTHRLDEVLRLADQVTVLRDGRLVTTTSARMTEQQLVSLILGRNLSAVYPTLEAGLQRPVLLEVDGLSVGPLDDIHLTVGEGEVLGIAGLLGSGRTTLLRALFGDVQPRAGEIRMRGVHIEPRSPNDALRHGIAYVPENRLRDATFADLSVSDNMSAATIKQFHNGVYFKRRQAAVADGMLKANFSIKASSLSTPIATLSGGNQQKVILARWMRKDPALILLDEPTQGIDVGARADVYALVERAVERGAAAIVVASDFEELAHVCDRIVVLRRGRITDEVSGAAASADLLTEMAHGTVSEGVPQ
ncbi:MAG: sugar ABC transporter ATP-binding protein [Ilumatobacteraceae bacterium]